MLAHEVFIDFDQAHSNFSLQYAEHHSLHPLPLALLRFARPLFARRTTGNNFEIAQIEASSGKVNR